MQELEIRHDPEKRIVHTTVEGHTAHVEYSIHDGMLDILHTVVPKPVEGRGIASRLVEYAYDYARRQGLGPAATCSYARIWLQRHGGTP